MTGIYRRGQVIELGDGRAATVQFAGQTSFADGDWVGVLLDEPTGKNDGSVKGTRYFECEPNHGMFLRPSAIAQILEEPTPKPAPVPKAQPNGRTGGASTGAGARKRPSVSIANGVRRPSQDFNAGKRQSINAASPSPAPRDAINGRKSPSKLATRAIASSATSTASSSRGATPPAASTRRNGPIATTSTRPAASRPSVTGARAQRNPTPSATRPARSTTTSLGAGAAGSSSSAHGTRTGPGATRPGLRSSVSGGPRVVNGARKPSETTKPAATVDESGADGMEAEIKKSHSQESLGSFEENPGEPTRKPAPSSGHLNEPSPCRDDGRKGLPLSAATSRHIQDLETQINVHKKQCDDYREQLSVMEKLRTEKDRYQAIIEKLQAKLQPQSQELSELKARLKETESTLEDFQGHDGDHEAELEMATLDREMAEEHAEAARLELNALKDRMAELQEEVEVLKEENNIMGEEVSPEERASQGWFQLERSNERLKEALIRLREITQDKESELTAQITSLENDLKQFTKINEQYEETKEKLQRSEAVVESLKEQLDEALDAENTTERLTAENMALQDHMDQLKMNIKELEDLRELNDELEYNHVEAEKQMQDEIDFKDSLISDQNRHATEQGEKLTDYEYTINKFRELVTSLQSGLEDMKASQQISDAEAEELSNRSKAMNDLNMKLQSSAEKAQMNTIDLETRRLEAQEAIEHLAIVQMFLPDSFKSERESILTYLRFRRVASKARLLHSLLKSTVSGERQNSYLYDVFVLCDLLDKLVWIAAMCERFINHIGGCSVEEFAHYKSALYELDPVEHCLNAYVEGIKQGDFREQAAADELQRTKSVLGHLASIHLKEDDLADYAEVILMRTTLLQSYLESTTIAMSHVRIAVGLDQDGFDFNHDPDDSLQQFNKDVQSFIQQTRSTKVVVSRARQTLLDLKARSMTLDLTMSTPFVDAEESAASLARLSCQLGASFRSTFATLELSTSSPSEMDQASLKEAVRTALRAFLSSHLPDTTSSSPLPSLSQKLKYISNMLSSILESAINLTAVSEFSRLEPPWSQRSAALRAAKQDTQNTETEILRLKDTVQSQSQQLRNKEQSLDENRVKIELLESRAKDATDKTARVAELSSTLDDVRKRERDVLKRVEAHAAEVATLNAEKERWRSQAESHQGENEGGEEGGGNGSVSPTPRGDRAMFSPREVDALRAEVESLTGTMRFLREEARRTKLARPDEPHMAWLQAPLFRKRKATTEQRDHKHVLKARAREVFDALRSVVTDSDGLIDLQTTLGSKAKGKWCPAKEKTGWRVARQREEWVLWQSQCRAIVRDAQDFSSNKRASETRKPSTKINDGAVGESSPMSSTANGHPLPPASVSEALFPRHGTDSSVNAAMQDDHLQVALSPLKQDGENELVGVAQ